MDNGDFGQMCKNVQNHAMEEQKSATENATIHHHPMEVTTALESSRTGQRHAMPNHAQTHSFSWWLVKMQALN